MVEVDVAIQNLHICFKAFWRPWHKIGLYRTFCLQVYVFILTWLLSCQSARQCLRNHYFIQRAVPLDANNFSITCSRNYKFWIEKASKANVHWSSSTSFKTVLLKIILLEKEWQAWSWKNQCRWYFCVLVFPLNLHENTTVDLVSKLKFETTLIMKTYHITYHCLFTTDSKIYWLFLSCYNQKLYQILIE